MPVSVKAFRHPRSGAVVVCDYDGIGQAVFYNLPVPPPDPEDPDEPDDGTENPEDPVAPDWNPNDYPSFILSPTDVGEVVRVDFGTTIPAGRPVTVRIGTGTHSAITDVAGDFAGPFIDNFGTIPEDWEGLDYVGEFTVSNGNLTKTIYVPSGVTVTEASSPVDYPRALTTADWTAEEVRDVPPGGRRRITVNASVQGLIDENPGYQLRLNSGPGGADFQPLEGAIMTPGLSYTTVSALALGTTCYNRLWWQRVDGGPLGNPSNTVQFDIQGLESPVVENPVVEIPAVNQTLTVVSAQAILNAAEAYRLTGSSAGWVLEIPDGNYGTLNFPDNYVMPGQFTVRSASWPQCGAVFSNINCDRTTRIGFQFIAINRGLQAPNAGVSGISGLGANYLTVDYCDLDGGPIAPFSGGGFQPHSDNAVDLRRYGNPPGSTDNTNCRVHMCYMHGSWTRGVDLSDTFDWRISENVFAEISFDDVFCAVNGQGQFLKNWGSRVRYVKNGAHCDFIQTNAAFSPGADDITVTGNVIMKQSWPYEYSPQQGIFSSKSLDDNHNVTNNIVLINSTHGVVHENGTNGAVATNNTATDNTCVAIVDGFWATNQPMTRVGNPGTGAVTARNVTSNSGAGTGGIDLSASVSNRSSTETLYERARVDSSFYDFRPKVGTAAHWAFSGSKVGAWQRFYDVIVGGDYPKIGPAALGWKLWYDPRNQITS